MVWNSVAPTPTAYSSTAPATIVPASICWLRQPCACRWATRVTVVGRSLRISTVATRLGNSMKRLNEPNIITIFVGIMFGIILGSIDLSFGMKLGLAGGPLVVAILISRFGYKSNLSPTHHRRHQC